MLEKPDIQDEVILFCLQNEYGLVNASLTFMPLGADVNTAVYRVLAGKRMFFLKLRGGGFDEMSVRLPRYLNTLGVYQVIPPIPTSFGQLTARLENFRLVLYPFIEGQNGYQRSLSDAHWSELGAALRKMHNAWFPEELLRPMRTEDYSDRWRSKVKHYLRKVESVEYEEPIARQVVTLLQSKRTQILDMVRSAERLALDLTAYSLPFVVCHGDLHAGNVLLTEKGELYIVDWDTLILAPKERDLMYIGGGLMGLHRTPADEEAAFYPSYADTTVNAAAIAYYRYERIIQDIAAFCQQLLDSSDGGEDRAQSLSYLKSNFLPNNVIQIAYQSDRTASQGSIGMP